MINNIFNKFTRATPGYAIVVSANDRIVFEKYKGYDHVIMHCMCCVVLLCCVFVVCI